MRLDSKQITLLEKEIERKYKKGSARGQIELFRLAASHMVEGRFSRRIEALCRIRNKSGDIVSIKLNAAQRKLVAKVVRMWRNGLPARVIILKPRQTGFSTIIELILFMCCVENSNRRASVIAHKRSISEKVLQMFKTAQRYAPFRVTMSRSATDVVAFVDPIFSSIDVDSAEAEEPGHGDTIQYLHTTEVSRWKDPERKMKGLLQTVPDLPRTLAVIESTANGVGGYFYNLWHSAVQGLNEYDYLFVAWFEHEEYTVPLLSESERVFVIETLNDSRWGGAEEEALLRTKYYKRKEGWVLVSLEQIVWRRRTIETKCNGDLDVFHEQYPATAEEAFVASGRPVFDAMRIKARRAIAAEPIWRGDLVDLDFAPRDVPVNPQRVVEEDKEEIPQSAVTYSDGKAMEKTFPWLEGDVPMTGFSDTYASQGEAGKKRDLDEHEPEDF